MLCNGRIFAAIAAFGAFAALTEANAQPPLAGLALQVDNTAIARVDYYYPRYDGYREDYYRRDNPLEIPAKLIGGVFGLVGGVLDGVFDDGGYYARPCYVSPYYGSPYYRASYNYGSYGDSSYYRVSYNDSPYSDSSYRRGGYYFDSRYGGDRFDRYYSRRDYELDHGYDYSYYYRD